MSPGIAIAAIAAVAISFVTGYITRTNEQRRLIRRAQKKNAFRPKHGPLFAHNLRRLNNVLFDHNRGRGNGPRKIS